MEHVKKMILVPSDTVARLQEKPHVPTPTDKVRELDNEMDQLLSQKGNEEERLRRYEQVLQRCMHFVSEQRKPFRLTIPGEPLGEHEADGDLRTKITNSMPKSLQTYTSQLYDVLKAIPNIKWDSKGIVSIDDTVLPHTNLSDLINDCLRKRKKANAESWETFVEALAKSNFPIGHINNAAYLKRIRELRGKGYTSCRAQRPDPCRKKKVSRVLQKLCKKISKERRPNLLKKKAEKTTVEWLHMI